MNIVRLLSDSKLKKMYKLNLEKIFGIFYEINIKNVAMCI